MNVLDRCAGSVNDSLKCCNAAALHASDAHIQNNNSGGAFGYSEGAITIPKGRLLVGVGRQVLSKVQDITSTLLDVIQVGSSKVPRQTVTQACLGSIQQHLRNSSSMCP